MKKFYLLLVLSCSAAASSDLAQIYKLYDKDQDKKITIEDKLPPQVEHTWQGMTIKGVYQLSNLAQELKYQELSGKPIDQGLIFLNPVDRISHSIRERYWDGLTRKIDKNTLTQVIADPKTKAKKYYLYLPPNDKEALEHYLNFKNKQVEVLPLPATIAPGKHGLLSLAIKNGQGVPYVVPGGRFNEMYGWDSYFHTLGVLVDGKLELARGMVDNFVYQINHYGKILNANRSYYLTRSQPPFLTSMIKAVYERMPRNEESKKWLADSLAAAIKEYETVWMGEERLTSTGLSRYAGFAAGIPPEVEPDHYDHVLKPYAAKHKMSVSALREAFNAGKLQDADLSYFFLQDRAVRESGHDTTYRWRVGKEDRASDFVTVDLNSLLYKYETDLAQIIATSFAGTFKNYKAASFTRAAKKRQELMMKFLWDKEKNLFFDYNFVEKKPSQYLSSTTFYPLWAGLVNETQAKKLASAALKELEQIGGLSATSLHSLKTLGDPKLERQWEYPNGWAPHQILAWEGMLNHGLKADAYRLIYKWLFMITKNAMDYHGTIPEKYDVVNRSHKVFAEYGNVGTDFSYITLEGFGWMNASYQIGLQKLPPEYLSRLKQLTPPEKINFADIKP